MGLPAFEGKYQPPPVIPFEYFKRLEAEVAAQRRDAFMDARIEYIDYRRDARDLIELARLARRPGGAGLAAARDYVERAVPELEGCQKALNVMVPLLPAF